MNTEPGLVRDVIPEALAQVHVPMNENVGVVRMAGTG